MEETVQRKGTHLKKRALKNKALGINFNEKDLKDYVTGFHKRKKKRRKEAQKQQNEALRRKRCEERKKVFTFPFYFTMCFIITKKLHSFTTNAGFGLGYFFCYGFCYLIYLIVLVLQRKLEREFVLYGGVPPNQNEERQEEVADQVESIAGTFSQLIFLAIALFVYSLVDLD